MQGKTIAHYKILDKLGEGGMGVVYRAEDTRLRRSVALKFLSAPTLAGEDSKARFLHEAQAAASLDHPNICGIFEIGEAEGRLFMAMPFIEGSGLDKRIAEGPRPVTEVLEVAIQMAEALEEAHSKQVVHRDIKPANVMVQERGRGRLHCVLMDFGLARLAQATKLTREGSQLGTAGYMSPEQVQGTAVDQRSDIWSLGVVLYEMAVGRMPFAAEYEQALFYGILNEQPQPMTALRTGLPMELERITGKCLAKEANQRYQNCTDLLVDLHALKRTVEGSGARTGSRVTGASFQPEPGQPSTPGQADPASASGAGSASNAVGSGTAVTQPAARRFSLLQVAAVALAVAAVAAGLTLVLSRPREQSEPTPQYTLRRVTWDGQLSAAPALSRDGQLLAYTSDRAGKGNLDIWVQQVDGSSLLQVTNDPADELQATFSPDGTKIAFMRFGQGVFIVPALGGEPYLVAEKAYAPGFSPDGKTISYLQAGKLYYSPINMGKPVELLAGVAVQVESPPLWAPAGTHLIYVGSLKGDKDWWAVPLDGSEPKSMGAAEAFRKAGLEWQDTEGWGWCGNHVVVDNSSEIYRVPVDAKVLRLSGPPERLTFGSGLDALASCSNDGKIAFTDVRGDRNIFSLKLDPRTGLASGEVENLTGFESRDTGSDISPDSRRLVYISNQEGALDVWAKDLSTGREVNLSRDSVEQWMPVLSPDGERVAYLAYEDGKPAIYVRPFAGGLGTPLCTDCGLPRSWTPDGRFLLFDSGSPAATEVLEVATGKRSPILRADGFGIDLARISPDGKWVAFHATGGEARLLIAPFHGDQPIPRQEWIGLMKDDSAWLPTWAADGNALYFTSGRAGSADIWMQRLEPATKRPAGEAQLVRRFPFMRNSIAMMDPKERRLAATRDRLVFPMSELAGSVWLMEPRETVAK
jgi:serine/threonine protein kinase/Tol biopolymer transport system component